MKLLNKLLGRAGIEPQRPKANEMEQDRQLWLSLMQDVEFSTAHDKALENLKGDLSTTDMKWQMSKWAMRAYATEQACLATCRDALAERLVAFIIACGTVSRPKSWNLSWLMLSRIYGEHGQADKRDRARRMALGRLQTWATV